jgi:RNA polymerase sigma factor (sigma-70 family)
MAHAQVYNVVRHIRRLVASQAAHELCDRDLLQAFSVGNDETAFAALVRRHGPMVLGVCRQVLGHEHDAEEAFQATFLVLARKAISIRKGEALGSWLHGVAYHTAMKAKTSAARRRVYEAQAKTSSPRDPSWEAASRELQAALTEEIHRLPPRYRAPFVLCFLEGQSRAEVARELGLKEGTVSSRLAQARRRLQERLARRGVALSAALSAVGLCRTAPAAIPGLLVKCTTKAALSFATGKAVAADLMSAEVAALAKGVLKTMLSTKLKIATVMLLVLGFGAAGMLTHSALADRPPKAEGGPAVNPSDPMSNDGPQLPVERPGPAKPGAQNQARTDRYGDPLPAGALARLGTVRFLHAGVVRSVAFSPDQKTLASAGDDKMIRLWDVATGKELQRFLGHDNWVYAIAFSPDGKMLASGSVDHTIRLWDVMTGKESQQLDGHEKEVNCIAFSPDGKILASGSNDKTIRFWDVGTGRQLRQRVGNPGQVCVVCFSPDGRVLASGSYDAGIHLWDANSGKELQQLGQARGGVSGLAFSADGALLAAGDSNSLSASLWEVRTGKQLLHLHNGKREFSQVALSPDGTVLATGGINGPVRLWDVASAKELRRSGGYESGAWALAISPDGKMLATGSPDHRVRLWQTSTGKQIYPFEGHTCGLRVLGYGSDSKTLISAGYDGTIGVWDVGSAKELHRFAAYQTNLHVALGYYPGRQTLVSTDVDQKIRFWNLATGEEKQRFDSDAGSCAAFFVSPDGKALAAGLKDRVIRLYDVRTGKEVRVLAGQQEHPDPAAFSPDGKWLAAVCFNKADGEMRSKLKVWNVETGAELPQFQGQRVSLGSTLAFSPDSKMVAAEADEKVSLWEIVTGKKRINLDQGRANSVAFAPNASTIASGHSDGTICLWEVATGKRICHLEGHQARVFSVAFSPDGRTLASGSEDATALIWDLAAQAKKPQPRPVSLAPTELESLWNDLGDGEADKSFQAMCKLETGCRQTVSFLQVRLRPVGPVPKARILQLLAELDSDSFAVREKATQELEKLGELAIPAMHKALVGTPSAEVQRRLERLLESARRAALLHSPERLRSIRALEVLEQIGTPEAQEVLKALAKGVAGVWLTEEARAARERLAKRLAAQATR